MRGACARDLIAQDVIGFVMRNGLGRSTGRIMPLGSMAGHGLADKRGDKRQQERGRQ